MNCRRALKFLRFDIIFSYGEKMNLFLTLFCMGYMMDVKYMEGEGSENYLSLAQVISRTKCARAFTFCLNGLTIMYLENNLHRQHKFWSSQHFFERLPKKFGGTSNFRENRWRKNVKTFSSIFALMSYIFRLTVYIWSVWYRFCTVCFNHLPLFYFNV